MGFSIRIKRAHVSLYLVIAGMWLLFGHEFLKSFAVNVMPVAYTGYLLLFFAAVLELKKRALSFVDLKYRIWVLSIWGFSFFALVYGIVQSHDLRFLSRDVWPYAFFACFLLAARTSRWAVIDKMIYQQFLVGLGVLVYIGLTLNIAFERSVIELNTESWDSPRIYWAWGLLYGWQYMFLTFNKDLPAHRKAATLIGVGLFVVFGIIMLKRQMIAEFALICFFKLVYATRVEKNNVVKWGIVFAGIALFVLVFVRFYERRGDVDYFDAISSRFTAEGSIIDTTLQNTRLMETPANIYRQASALEVLWGQGLGSAVEKDHVVDSVVESGFFTIFMKGGVFYLFIWYLGFVFVLKDVLLGLKSRRILFGLLSAMFIIPSAIAPFFIAFPSCGYQMFWLGKYASRVRYFRPDELAG